MDETNRPCNHSSPGPIARVHLNGLSFATSFDSGDAPVSANTPVCGVPAATADQLVVANAAVKDVIAAHTEQHIATGATD